MNIIVAVDQNWAIGYNNQLLTRIPADLKRFREMTKGRVVVMGRKTLESLPGGRPLDDRVNIVFTENKNLEVKGAKVVHDVDELQEALRGYTQDNVFVIGGGSVYRLLLPFCDTAYVTMIDHTFQADTYFPNLDELSKWKVTDRSEEQTYFDLEYHYVCYSR